MHSILETVILGIIQGLTEFLPVSSSGHLEIAKYFFGEKMVGEESMLLTVVLHFATALSTIVVFRKDILDIIAKFFKGSQEETGFVFKIIVSMIPAVVVGLFFEDFIESLFGGNLFLVAAMLVVTGFLLFIADRIKQTDKSVGYVDAIVVGVVQAIAILPGISRSGATIASSVILGIDRSKAARFSFLMVVPLIFGKMAKDLLSGDLASTSMDIVSLGAGFIAAFVTGYFACTWMIALVRKSQLRYFAFYCFAVALIVFITQIS